MIGYFLLLAIEIGLWFLFYRLSWAEKIKKPQLWYLSLSFFVLFLFSSFRAPHIGTDYHSYISAMKHVIATGTYYMESGFILLIKFILLFTRHHFGLAIATNLILMVPLLVMIIRCVERKYWPLCVMIFMLNPYMFIQSSFNIMRQGCATGLIIVALMLLVDKRYWVKILSVLFIFVAAKFHRMAYSLLVLIPIVLVNWRRTSWIVIGTVAFLINMCNIDLFSLAIRFVSTKYVDYEGSLLNIGIYAIFIYAVILFISYHYDSLCVNKKSKHFVDIYLFSLSYMLIALPNDIAYRIYIMIAFAAIPAVPIIWRVLGKLRPTDLPIIGTLGIWKRIPWINKLSPIKLGYITYYFGFFFCYIVYLWLAKNTAYIPFSFGF